MGKNQVLEMVKEKMELSTKKDAELFIERLGDLLNGAFEVLEAKTETNKKADDTIRLGDLTIKKVHKKERKGTSTLGEKKEWVKEAHDELKITFKVK